MEEQRTIEPCMLYAVVLDPRVKLHYIEWLIKKMYSNNVDIMHKVKEGIYAHFEEYKESSNPHESCTSIPQSQHVHVLPYERRLLDYVFEWGWRFWCAKWVRQVHWRSKRKKWEPIRYILNWWKLNASRFFILVLITRDILAFFVSTVTFESTFNMRCRVFDTFKSLLTLRIVQCLVYIKDCFQQWSLSC